ncbi:MAG: hypothetical protein PF636_00400, partial [Actinomycetota bacterium]|nr:hypothetical protein [Actinomycetota bacterium]
MSLLNGNMARSVSLLCCVGVLVFALPMVALAVDGSLTPADVVEIDRGLDGTYIEFQGEAIGEALRADSEHVWVNVLGGGMAVGVYLPSTSAELIETFGDHRHDGDVVRVGGIVNVGCDQHAGEFDVHAATFEIISRGSVRD